MGQGGERKGHREDSRKDLSTAREALSVTDGAAGLLFARGTGVTGESCTPPYPCSCAVTGAQQRGLSRTEVGHLGFVEPLEALKWRPDQAGWPQAEQPATPEASSLLRWPLLFLKEVAVGWSKSGRHFRGYSHQDGGCGCRGEGGEERQPGSIEARAAETAPRPGAGGLGRLRQN